MKPSLVAFAAVLLGASSLAKAQEIHWHTDYRSAREEARKANKPILLEFRCSP
jgi:hypothetical protein